MKTTRISTIFVLCTLVMNANAQGFKDKMKSKMPAKDKSEIYECGYVHQLTLKEKANPMKALQKGIAGGVTDGSNPDLGSAAISVFYQAHLHPQSIMRYPTSIPGWETCGDAVFAGFTNRDGLGLSSTDGSFQMDGQDIAYSGAGTYFQGFKPSERGEKKITITSSNGNKVEVDIAPGAPLEIKTIDGKSKGEPIDIDGTKDIVIELEGGDADLNSRLHVQMVCKLVGTPIMYDIIVTRASNTIYIPKEAFKNFEGSPAPFNKNNTLIVNRVTEKIIDDTDAGALRTISAYMDWWPVSIGGDLSKGNMITMGFDSTKNTNISIDLKTTGEYQFTANKQGPYLSPPINLMKNVAVASFVVRGNMTATKTSTEGDWLVTRKKWFPEYSESTWKDLTEKLYAQFKTQLETQFDMQIIGMDKVVGAESYAYAKTITDDVTQNFVEVGAGGTKRILTTSFTDLNKDLGITFPGDFVSERLVNELGVDAVIAVTIDLNFNYTTEGLDPVISIEAFAPNVSYKTAAKYFSMKAQTKAKSLSSSKAMAGTTDEIIYNMIKAEEFISGFGDALKQLDAKENEYPVYEKLWKAKF